MSVKLDRSVFIRSSNGTVRFARNRQVYVLETNGPLDRAVDLDDETLVEGFADEDLTDSVGTGPFTSNTDGQFDVWFPAANYDIYTPSDNTRPITRWQPMGAGVPAEVASLSAAVTALDARTDSMESAHVIVTAAPYSATGDGTTDDTAAFTAAIAAVYAAGGGTVFVPEGTYRIDGQIILPNDSDPDNQNYPNQKAIRLTGVGSHMRGQNGAPIGGSILDMRYNGAGAAKIVGLGRGVFEMDHLTLRDQGDTGKPFCLFTGTISKIHHVAFFGHSGKSGTACNQDAVIYGGASPVLSVTGVAATDTFTSAAHGMTAGTPMSFFAITGGAGIVAGTTYYVIASGLTANEFKVSATLGGASINFTTDLTAGTIPPRQNNDTDSPFQGYGSSLVDCMFQSIRRCAFVRTYANGIRIAGNWVLTGCGSNLAGGAAFEYLGVSTNVTTGNFLVDNTIEAIGYPYPVKLDYAKGNTLGPNGFYDPSATTTAYYRCEANAQGNTFIDGYHTASKPFLSEHASMANQNTIRSAEQGVPNRDPKLVGRDVWGTFRSKEQAVFEGGNLGAIVQPLADVTNESHILLRIMRSAAQVTNGRASAVIADFLENGGVRIGLFTQAPAAPTDGVTLHSNGSSVLRGRKPSGATHTFAQGLIGKITAGGAIAGGSGFSAVKNSTGNYTITFTTAFVTSPIVIVTSENDVFCQTQAVGTGSAIVICKDAAGALTDAQFGFMAMESA